MYVCACVRVCVCVCVRVCVCVFCFWSASIVAQVMARGLQSPSQFAYVSHWSILNYTWSLHYLHLQ